MKVLQLIDSLEPGGAERVAVNMANALRDSISASFLCATRKEGILKSNINPRVDYLFLNKSKKIDFKAIKKLNSYIKTNQIDIIHAHSSSFFLATIIKILNKNIHLVWHDHYGNSEFLAQRKFKILKRCSKYFSHTFTVNQTLETWVKQNLNSKSVSFLPNFAIADTLPSITKLAGENHKRIVHLANLRPQKDHFTLIKAFSLVSKIFKDWTLHLIGKDFNDAYSKSVKSLINELKLENKIIIYGSKTDIASILNQSDFGVLSSKSEGLPLALLEYGLAKLPVIATDVGATSELILNKKSGILIPPMNVEALKDALIYYIENSSERKLYSENYHNFIIENYALESQIKNIVDFYKTLIN